MAKKTGKIKISRLKRNNHTTNKMKKRGEMKLQRHKPKAQKQKSPSTQKEFDYGSPSESGSEDEFGDMLDDEEQAYMMKTLAKNPELLSSVPDKDVGEFKQPKKRKRPVKPMADISPDSGAESDSDASISDMEDKYEQELADRPAKRMRPLLPIKTKQGLMQRAVEMEDEESDSEPSPPPPKTKKQDLDEPASDSDSGMEGTAEDDGNTDSGAGGDVVTTVQLMAARKDTLNREKLRIGALCSALLESPDKKLKNLYPILYLMEEKLKDGTANLHSLRKIAILSAYEVFKDILPEYQIRHQDYSNIKLKKDTLTMYKSEKELLEFYKRYLQKLEKFTSVLRRKKGDNRKPDEAQTSLALISLQCMCGLLQSKPYFNYAVNIAQSVVPMLGGRQREREIVQECCQHVFVNDNKGDITLTIVRLINQLAKKRGERLHESALDCLLSLKIKDIELDAAADVRQKQKQEERHKKRIVNLSKKEKKRAKKLKEVERELLETQAQESELTHKKQMTEVTKTVFHIYFRILKTAPHSKLLAAVLKGLAKFTHVINLEYYTELVAILARLLSDEDIGVKEKILCVRTALAILAGAGDALNVDPAKFHAYLYESMLYVHAGTTQDNAAVILSALSQICSRARRVSSGVLQACTKRLSTMALHLHHNGAIAALVLMYNLAQQSKAVLSLFESSDEAIGSGRFDPYLNSPEHCNAHSASLHELTMLSRHYHPTARAVASALRASDPNVPVELKKITPSKIYIEYDGSKMSFKPSIPPPNKEVVPKTRIATAHNWVQSSLKQYCLSTADNVADCTSSVNFEKHLASKV